MKDVNKSNISINKKDSDYNDLSKRRFLSRFKGRNIDNYVYNNNKSIDTNNNITNYTNIDMKKTEYITTVMKNFYLIITLIFLNMMTFTCYEN
jgi:hypothetical protein